MEIVQGIDKEQIAKDVAEYISTLVIQAAREEKDTLLLLSGGSALAVTDLFSDALFTSRLTVGVVDERYSSNVESNNFLQLQERSVYIRLTALGAHSVNSVPQEGELLPDFAKRIENSWKDWKREHQEGKVIALMGMGPDGHTAGIMPYLGEEDTLGKLFTDNDIWVSGYDAGDKNKYPLRATATFSFLKNEVDETVVYITGEEKEEALKRVMQEEGSLSETPARIVREMKSVRIFTINKVY